jgi:ligand-binding sensor domain-containing protein/signal transduction histidine kinase
MLEHSHRRKRPAVFLAFCCLFSLLRFCAGASPYLIDSWDSEKGLPDNFVTSIVQTPDGYLWIGTYNGLARFDGSRFVTFKPENTPQLGHERIVKLFLDSQGTLWINTYDGSLTTLRNGVFTREWNGAGKNISEAWLISSNSRRIIFAFRSGLLISRATNPGGPKDWQVLKPPGHPHGATYPNGATYCQDQTGSLWCSTLDGNLWRIRNSQYELVPKNAGLRGQTVNWLAADLSGHIWAGTEKELAEWNGERFQNMAPQGEGDLNVAALSFTRDGAILVAANGRLRKLLNGKWVAEFDAWPDLMQEQQFHSSLYEDREGGIWRVSRGMGIFHIDPKGVTRQISTGDGMPGDHATSFLEDQESNIWVGLGNSGLARLRLNHFETLAAPGEPSRPAISVCEDQSGALWVGTYGGGLDCWQNGSVVKFQIPTQKWDDFVFSVYPDTHGKLWISAGLEDLFRFEGGKLEPSPVAVHAVKSILVDREGRVWLGRKDGLDCWADGKLGEWTPFNGPLSTPVRAVAEDTRGIIWIGADDGNIYHFDGGQLQALQLPAYPAHQGIWSLLADADGTLWIGTADAGLLHLDGGRFVRFTSKAGLPDDLICQILDDQQGNLWLGSHHGICRVSKAALAAFAAGKTSEISCSIYGRSDGLPTLQCSDMYQPSAWRGADGKLWFATARGVVGVQPAEVPVNSRTPPVVIEEFLIGGKSQALPAGDRSHPALLKISPGMENFEFHYTALSLTDSDKIQFRYKLEGFDSDWVNPGGRRWAQYSYLSPGTYRFRVMACNNDGLWNQAGATIDVRVLPHFWETWWFLSLLGLASIAGVASVVRYVSYRQWRREMARLEHQRDLERDRTRIARDIHDHIGSGLTRINLLNELLLGDPACALPQRVAQITSVTCELMGAMDEIVWALNPKNDTLDSLISYLSDFAVEYLRAAKIVTRINVPSPLPAWQLTSEVRHNVFLAVKEILNNIVKHSRAGEVCLTLKLGAGPAAIEIRDNGRGFQVASVPLDMPIGAAHSTGNGLDNLQKRASSIGGECLICSAPGTGTSIELTIPEPKEERPRSTNHGNASFTLASQPGR